jgi:hypothetical protein
MGAVIGFVLGAIIGVLACYAWQKGMLQDAGVK